MPKITIVEAYDTLKAAMQADPQYAWGWHCNIACAIQDEGIVHKAANSCAARAMAFLFSVDTSKAPRPPKEEETVEIDRFNLTAAQIVVMQYTVSSEDRNWFATDCDTKDAKLFEELVRMGLARKRTPPAWMAEDVIYSLTPTGKLRLVQALRST